MVKLLRNGHTSSTAAASFHICISSIEDSSLPASSRILIIVCLLTVAILGVMYVLMVLIYISLMTTKDIEHLPMCLVVICTFWEKCLFQSLSLL